jgi:hypothetical protein
MPSTVTAGSAMTGRILDLSLKKSVNMYSRINFTKTPASAASNFSEPQADVTRPGSARSHGHAD